MSTSPQPRPTPLLVERRFPLDLSQSILSIRSLYETAKAERWDPSRDLDWSFERSRYDSDTLHAARQVWSRRAWIEYTGLAETPALLIRFCLEREREADPKYFLSVRNTEEAWHVECFHRLAQCAGGYLDRPSDPAWEAVINQSLYRQALDAEQPLDPYVATHCALEDGLELELFEAYASNARDTLVKSLLKRVVADKRRHAAFGWLYLESRAELMNAEAKSAVAAALSLWLRSVAFAGYHLPSLTTELDATSDIAAQQKCAAAGLGALGADEEEALFVSYIARARVRLGELGIELVPLDHYRLGRI